MSLRDRWNRFRTVRTPAAGEPGAARPRTLGGVRILLAALLCLAIGAMAGVLLLQHHGDERASAAVSRVCGEGDQTGCEVVARSRFSEVGGIPLAAIGIFFYLAVAVLLLLALLAGPEARDAATALAFLALVAALAVDLVLLGVQMIAIRAFCRLCLLTYAVTVLALLVLGRTRRDGAVIGQALRRPDGRVVLAGWLLATLALGAAVLAAEVGLSYREKERLATLLGPAPAASPAIPSELGSPAAPGGDAQRFQEEARAAAEQARRLQEILDDPQKLEQYFADKAAREYEQGPVHRLRLEGVPVKGPASAPIKVAEYSDFLCPFCRQIAGAFSQYLPSSAGRVAIYYKNYPLDAECNPHVDRTIHPGACLLARAGICAEAQEKFWPYHDRVFAGELKDPQAADVARMAAEAGLDPTALQACLASAATRARLAAEVEEAWKAGVRATPTVFINGKKLPRINDFVQTVEKEAARLGLPPLPKSD
ncbi:MAG TPA: thioredoxin domain-containing protein [Vicinamibacteria bacterium]|nr:thioredoxin domain-containing protein [Vicinamibacteria bacterium]